MATRGRDKFRAYRVCLWAYHTVSTTGPLAHSIPSGCWFWTFLFFHVLRIVIPIDFHLFQRGGSTTNQTYWLWKVRYQSRNRFIGSFQEPCKIWPVNQPVVISCGFLRSVSQTKQVKTNWSQTQMLHVWNIYLHFGHVWLVNVGKSCSTMVRIWGRWCVFFSLR